MGSRCALVSAVMLSVLLAGTAPAAGASAPRRCTRGFRRAPGRSLRLGNDTVTPAAGDFNGDRRPDLVVGAKHGVRILFGRGDGRFRVGPRELGSSSAATSVAVADFNGDGLADVAAGVPPDLSVLLGDGRGGFSLAGTFPLRYAWIGSAAADFNRDGRQDVALLGQRQGTQRRSRGRVCRPR